jgi:hypothetical protein
LRYYVDWGSNPVYRTRGEHANHYATDAVEFILQSDHNNKITSITVLVLTKIEILCMVIIRILIYIVLNRRYPIFWFWPTHGPWCHGLVINIYLVSPLQVSLVVMIIQGRFFFSYLADFSYFPLFSILELFWQCGILELFQQCGIFCFSFYWNNGQL